MIHEKLLQIEYASNNDKEQTYSRAKTINDFKEWLKQIDRNAEVIPIGNTKRLNNLMASLKGKALNTDEYDLIEEIINK